MAVLRDVRETVLDGQLGFSGRSGSGISVRIGPSPIVSDKLIIITGDMTADTIKERLGRSPLADSVMDSVQFGAARVYCLPVAASTAGTVGEVEKEGKGGGKFRMVQNGGLAAGGKKIFFKLLRLGKLDKLLIHQIVKRNFPFPPPAQL